MLAAAGLALAALAAAEAAGLTIILDGVSSPVKPSSDARVQIRTNPGATCSITVRDKSGPSKAPGLGPQTADANGHVTWGWRVGSNAARGRWPILIVCQQKHQRAELRTSFDVR